MGQLTSGPAGTLVTLTVVRPYGTVSVPAVCREGGASACGREEEGGRSVGGLSVNGLAAGWRERALTHMHTRSHTVTHMEKRGWRREESWVQGGRRG